MQRNVRVRPQLLLTPPDAPRNLVSSGVPAESRIDSPGHPCYRKGVYADRLAAVAILLPALGCAPPVHTVHPPATVPAPVPACSDWSLVETGRFTQEALFGPGEIPGLGKAQGPGGALGDLDGDGWLDLLFTVRNGRSFGFLNDGTGVLVPDETLTVDGAPLPAASSVALADLDDDGDLDGVLARERGVPDLVIHNQGGGEFISSELQDSAGESLSPVFGDLDGDGRLDLFIGGFAHSVNRELAATGATQGEGSKLYFQIGPGEWADRTSNVPPLQLVALNHHTAVLDSDLDGDLDLYLANEAGIGNVNPALLVNDGAGQFSIATQCFCDEPIAGMGAAVGDPNGDGRPDLFVTNLTDHKLYLNEGANQFLQAASALGTLADDPESDSGWGAAFVDLDADTDEDLPVVFGMADPSAADETHSATQPDVLLERVGDQFEVRNDLLGDRGVARTVLVGDLNRDGRPDLVVIGRVYVVVYLAEGGCDPGITLSLDAGDGNRQGIGARVEVTTPTAFFTRWMLPSVTYGSSAAELYLGLNNQPVADLRITWPDGTIQEVAGLQAGERHTIRQE